MGDGWRRRKKRETTENSGRRRGTAGDDGDDTISSILVPEFFLSGKFRKRRDGTTECRPSSSLIPTCRATLENDRTGRQNVVRPRPPFLLAGQLEKMTGRDDKLPSVLVLAQDGRTAPLRTLLLSGEVMLVMFCSCSNLSRAAQELMLLEDNE